MAKEGSERTRQLAETLTEFVFNSLDRDCEWLIGRDHVVKRVLGEITEFVEAGGRSLEQERDELRGKLDDLIACWDVFYKFLPDSEYQGLGQMRAAINHHRAALKEIKQNEPG